MDEPPFELCSLLEKPTQCAPERPALVIEIFDKTDLGRSGSSAMAPRRPPSPRSKR